MFSYFLYFVAGIAVSAIIAYVLHRSIVKIQLAATRENAQQQTILHDQLQLQFRQLQNEKEILITQASKADYLNDALQAQTVAFEKLQQDHQFTQNQFATIKEKLKSAEDKLASQKEELNQIGESFKFEFRNLAQNILDEKTKKFTEVNEEKMKAILDPLKNDLGNF